MKTIPRHQRPGPSGTRQTDTGPTDPERAAHAPQPEPDERRHGAESSTRGVALLAASGAVILWAAQPPLQLWPLAWVALVPWMLLILHPTFSRRQWAILYGVGVIYWAVTMQGLRHAHPAMYGPWLALAAYLGTYPLAWVALVRVAVAPRRPADSPSAAPGLRVPLWLAAPVVWVGLECVRNYFLTGISAVMLGHTQANVPVVIQIADAWGSYGVSFVIVLVNAAIAAVIATRPAVGRGLASDGAEPSRAALWPWTGMLVATTATIATVGYGYWRLAQVEATSREAEVNIALIGRDEAILFQQDSERELEIFDAYFQQSYAAAEQAAARGIALDAVVWPESMFTGSLPWFALDRSRPLAMPPDLQMDESEFRELLSHRQRQFEQRAGQVQTALRVASGQSTDPELIVGCSVVSYNEPPGGHSGCVQIGPGGRVEHWYAKNHLVMFGEYIPLMQYLPWIDRVVPPGLGILPGQGPTVMRVGELALYPNICIETAVERVPVNHVRQLIERDAAPDLIVNITNDGWFNRTSIIEHHLRCAQLVAVACRRPLLIAANGGPTAWIDGSGRVVERLRSEAAGSILVSGQLDGRSGLYLRIGDLPARLMAICCGVLLVIGLLRRRSDQRRALAAA